MFSPTILVSTCRDSVEVRCGRDCGGMLGPDHVRLLPVTALAGAIFLVITDTIARTLFAPNELPVGILMAFLGGPFFLYLLRKNKREYTL